MIAPTHQDSFNDLYNTEENIASIITFASTLAVIIACHPVESLKYE
jgi:hypothetical protein